MHAGHTAKSFQKKTQAGQKEKLLLLTIHSDTPCTQSLQKMELFNKHIKGGAGW